MTPAKAAIPYTSNPKLQLVGVQRVSHRLPLGKVNRRAGVKERPTRTLHIPVLTHVDRSRYTGEELRFIRARKTNFKGEMQR